MSYTARTSRHLSGTVAAIVTLAALVAGVPLALTLLAGNPLPARVPSLDDVLVALTQADRGRLFLRLLAIAGWLGWASFVFSVAAEATGRILRRRVAAIPGLSAQQRLAAALIGAILSAGASASFTSADAAPAAALVAGDQVGNRTFALPQPPPDPGGQVLHLVERGQALLDLQERYGVSWQRIAEANYGRVQPDGRTLDRGHTRIYPGWQLSIPAGAGAAPASQHRADGHEQQLRHTVAPGDWLWHIAERYLDDPTRFPEIAELNPQYAGRHSTDGRLAFPDYLEPGWTLRLPLEALDRGPSTHAMGEAAPAGPAEQPPMEPDSAQDLADQPAVERATPPLASPATPAAPEATTSVAPEPTTSAAPEPSVPGVAGADEPVEDRPGADEPVEDPPGDGDFGPADDDPDLLAPGRLASAGLLVALVLGAVAWHRLRRRQHHDSGLSLTAASARLERTLRAAAQPLDAERLDAALRSLAANLAGRAADLPDVAGAVIEEGTVRLLLAAPCPSPPAPWLDQGDRWTLPADAALPAAHALAPLPGLVTVGSQPARHVLLDLERLGVLTVYGDPDRSAALLRYLAAELACNTWSDSIDVLLAGFDPADGELLATLGPGRVRVLPSVVDAAALLRRRVAAAATTLQHSGAADALAGRVHGLAGDSWMPQVLLAATPDEAGRAALAELRRELSTVGRCGVAVVTTGQEQLTAGGWRVAVTAGGTAHLRLPFIRVGLSAAGLDRADLVGMAGEVRHAEVGTPEPAQPEPAEPAEPPATATPADPAELSEHIPADDPYLDSDLAAWYADDPGRPRIGVLGPVRVDATGPLPETRRRLHAELIVFLAQRGPDGADAGTLREALWPGRRVADADWQLALSRARRWLGTDPAGSPWLADAGADLTYRIIEGYLLDWQLFRRLCARARARDEADDLHAALQLVRGVPLDGAERPPGPGARNPYPWLPGSAIQPDLQIAAVVDTAHQLAERCADSGDTDGVRWAVQQAWLADASRSYDQPWRDLLRAEHADGGEDRLRSVLAELMEVRDAEAPEDLAPDTYHLVRDWLPSLMPSPASTRGHASDLSA